MRRLARCFWDWWRAQHLRYGVTPPALPTVIVEQPMDTLVEYEPVGPLPAPPPVPTAPWDWSGYSIVAEAVAISHARQRQWRDLPRGARRIAQETAREVLARDPVLFVADELPLPDDLPNVDVDWIVTIFNLLTARRDALPLPQKLALYRAIHTPHGARLTLTVWLPSAAASTQEDVVLAVRREVQSVLGPVILWGQVDVACYRSDSPAWAVTIGAMDDPDEWEAVA